MEELHKQVIKSKEEARKSSGSKYKFTLEEVNKKHDELNN